MSRPVIVVGGGVNGLVAAALLAKRGRPVRVLERASEPGGLAAGHEFHPGYHTAGTLQDTSHLRDWVVDELGLEKHGLQRTAGVPGVFAPERDGRGILIAHDADEASAEIAAHCARDAERYREYRAFLARIAPLARRVLNSPPPDPATTSPWHLMSQAWAFRRLGARDIREILRVAPMCTADWLGEWFETERLSSALTAPALVAGSVGPWSPSTNGLLLRHEVLAGRAAVHGPRSVVAALLTALTAHGGTVQCGSEVTDIRFEAGRARGVTLASGEDVDADEILITSDPRTALLGWIPPSECAPELASRLHRFRSVGTTAVVHLALNTPLRFAGRPDLAVAHAVTGETFDELERSFDPAKYGQGSERPFLDVHVPSIADPELAPSGHAVVSILAHAFAGAPDREWVGDQVVSMLDELAPGIESSVVGRQVLTPADLADRHSLGGGHLYHGEHGLDQLLARPCPECSGYRTPWPGIVLGGSGSWPGGGISGLPGALAARATAQPSVAGK